MWPAIISAVTAPLWVPPMYKGLKGGIDEVFGTDLSGERLRRDTLSRYAEGVSSAAFLDDEAELMYQESLDGSLSLLDEGGYDPLGPSLALQKDLALRDMLEANSRSLDAISIKDDGRPSFEEVALRMGLA